MNDDLPNPTAPQVPAMAMPDAIPAPTAPSSAAPAGEPGVVDDVGAAATRERTSAAGRPHRPEYKGAELDPERGPGLGCFWFQLIVLGVVFLLIPIGLNLNWPFELLAFLLFVVIGLLLLTGQSVIFLLRLVAADRRAKGRRRPLASPTRTVGEIEDVAASEVEARPPSTDAAARADPDAGSAGADGTARADETARDDRDAGSAAAEEAARTDETAVDDRDAGPARTDETARADDLQARSDDTRGGAELPADGAPVDPAGEGGSASAERPNADARLDPGGPARGEPDPGMPQ